MEYSRLYGVWNTQCLFRVRNTQGLCNTQWISNTQCLYGVWNRRVWLWNTQGCMEYGIPYGQKLDPSEVCFGWYFQVLALSVRKRIFLKTKKADQKHCENWWRGSGSEFHKASPMCERCEWRKQLRDFTTQSLKQAPLGSGTIWSIFWHNGQWRRPESSLLYTPGFYRLTKTHRMPYHAGYYSPQTWIASATIYRASLRRLISWIIWGFEMSPIQVC